jgi:hypothetical protein
MGRKVVILASAVTPMRVSKTLIGLYNFPFVVFKHRLQYPGQISLAPPSFQARALSEPSLSTSALTQSKWEGFDVVLINVPLAAGVILEANVVEIFVQ